jgi:hypothetical protein
MPRLVEHVWALALGEAVARVGGAEALAEFVDAVRLSDVAEPLLAAAPPSG